MCRRGGRTMNDPIQNRNVELSIGYTSLALFGISLAVLAWFLYARVDSQEPVVDLVRREIERATEGRGDASATFNLLLMLSWGFLHSFMTRKRFKVHLQKVLKPHLEPA